MTHPNNRFFPFYGMIAILTWSSAYPVVRLAMKDIPPVPLAALRYVLAALLAGLWLLYKRPALPERCDIPRLVASGVFGITLYNIFFNLGEKTVSASTTSLLIASQPVMVGVLAVLFAGECFTFWGWIGSLLSFSGVVLIFVSQQSGLFFGSGAFMVLAAAFFAAVYTVLQRPLVQRYGGLLVTAYVLIVGAIMLLPWLGEGMKYLFHAPERTWLCVAELGIFPATLGYAAWSSVIGIVGAARAAVFIYFLPPVTFLLSFWLEGEWPDVSTLLGGAVVMLGVCITQILGRAEHT